MGKNLYVTVKHLMTERLKDILQLVGTAVVKFEFCADKHLASLSGFQQKLYAKPVWGKNKTKQRNY